MKKDKKIIAIILWILATAFFLLSVFLYVTNEKYLNFSAIMPLYGIAAILLIILITTEKKIVKLGPLYIILLYMIISIFSYDILSLIINNSNILESSVHAATEYYNQANALSYMAIYAIIVGASTYKANENRELKYNKTTETESKLYKKISLILIIAYCIILTYTCITNAQSLNNYKNVKSIFGSNSILMYSLRLFWVALPIYTIYSNNKDLIRISPIILIIFAILMFTGNRNEILYPLAMAFGIYIWKRKTEGKDKIPKIALIVIPIILFVINPIISSTRKNELGNYESGTDGIVSGLEEMGQQINPLSLTLKYLNMKEIKYKNRMTIIEPTLAIISLNTIYSTKSYESSNNNMSYVLARKGHIGKGYSSIAEIYLNFRVLGLLLIMFMFGRYCCKQESRKSSNTGFVIYAGISTLFMLWCRNTLSLNIIIIIFTLIIVVLVRIINRKTNLKDEKTQSLQIEQKIA